ncbi:hypothetical protein C5167_025741 [Papaver somniferum]|uniref:Uncharacterized protein n=1 Tax=Papaver somniferum TaxID=3469 RepID=A0A4Y7JSB6_PAPSO|nr:hypothetical protein C5167_025741 [Papaver somniferum]
MQSSLLNSTVSFGTYAFNKPYNESSLFPKKSPFLHDFAPPRKLVLTVSNKKQKPLIIKSSIQDFVKTSAFFQSLSNMIGFKFGGGLFEKGDLPLFKGEDLIQLKHNGKCIVGVVQHIGFLETTLIGPTGLIILQNSKIDLCAIINFTKITGSDKLFGFHTHVDCNTDPSFFMENIESLLDKDENVKENIAYSIVYMLRDPEKILVSCYVNCSKLQIPQFKSYLQFGGQIMSSSAVSFGPHAFNKPYTESSLFPKKNPFLHDFVPAKKLVLTVSNKKQKPLIVNSSIKDSVKTSAVSVFQSLASFDTWVVQSLSNLIEFKPKANRLSSGLFVEGDLIQLKHNGKRIPLMVQHIGFLETTLTCIGGLIILHNHKIDKGSITNLTIRDTLLLKLHKLTDTYDYSSSLTSESTSTIS